LFLFGTPNGFGAASLTSCGIGTTRPLHAKIGTQHSTKKKPLNMTNQPQPLTQESLTQLFQFGVSRKEVCTQFNLRRSQLQRFMQKHDITRYSTLPNADLLGIINEEIQETTNRSMGYRKIAGRLEYKLGKNEFWL